MLTITLLMELLFLQRMMKYFMKELLKYVSEITPAGFDTRDTDLFKKKKKEEEEEKGTKKKI